MSVKIITDGHTSIIMKRQKNAECYIKITAECYIKVTAEFYIKITAEFYIEVTAECYIKITAECYVKITEENLGPRQYCQCEFKISRK